jgi:glucuronate isomerase
MKTKKDAIVEKGSRTETIGSYCGALDEKSISALKINERHDIALRILCSLTQRLNAIDTIEKTEYSTKFKKKLIEAAYEFADLYIEIRNQKLNQTLDTMI